MRQEKPRRCSKSARSVNARFAAPNRTRALGAHCQGPHRATPASFHAHQASRSKYYEISTELANSDFDLFAGGPPKYPNGKSKDADQQTYLLYGGYEPYAIKVTHVLNQKSGISWTSYSHTGIPVQTSAIGVGAEMFNGYYDQTDIHAKMMAIAGLQYIEQVASSK